MAFRNPIVAATRIIREAFQSSNFVEAVSGWSIDKTGKAQFENVNVTGNFGATAISADEIRPGLEGGLLFADGTEVRNYVDRKPNNLVACWEYNAGTDITSITAEQMILETSAVFIPSTSYELSANAQVMGSVANDAGMLIVRFTSDGTRPTATSTIIAVWPFNIPPVANRLETYQFDRQVYISNSNPHAGKLIRFGLFIRREAGTGAFTVFGSGGARRPQLSILENSPFLRFTGANGSDPDVAPTSRYTKTYPAVWSQTYAGNNSKRDDTNGNTYAYQGYFSSTWENQRSLVGFDYTKIQADLTGATIVSCYVTIKCAHAGESAGLDVRLGTHNYTLEPDVWSSTSVVERRIDSDNLGEGSSRKINLGTTIGGEFKSGASKGVAFGPTLDTSRVLARYGYLYGAPTTSKPVLEITFDK